MPLRAPPSNVRGSVDRPTAGPIAPPTHPADDDAVARDHHLGGSHSVDELRRQMILHRATKFITLQVTLGFWQLAAVEFVERQMDLDCQTSGKAVRLEMETAAQPESLRPSSDEYPVGAQIIGRLLQDRQQLLRLGGMIQLMALAGVAAVVGPHDQNRIPADGPLPGGIR